eukprot:6479125-Amphidinium_carterae.4
MSDRDAACKTVYWGKESWGHFATVGLCSFCHCELEPHNNCSCALCQSVQGLYTTPSWLINFLALGCSRNCGNNYCLVPSLYLGWATGQGCTVKVQRCQDIVIVRVVTVVLVLIVELGLRVAFDCHCD